MYVSSHLIARWLCLFTHYSWDRHSFQSFFFCMKEYYNSRFRVLQNYFKIEKLWSVMHATLTSLEKSDACFTMNCLIMIINWFFSSFLCCKYFQLLWDALLHLPRFLIQSKTDNFDSSIYVWYHIVQGKKRKYSYYKNIDSSNYIFSAVWYSSL